MKIIDKDPFDKGRFYSWDIKEYRGANKFTTRFCLIIILICVIAMLALIVYDIFII